MAFLDFLGPIGNVVGSLVGAGSALIGGNEQADAQRESNAQNYKMFQEQLGFTKDMWNKTNEYNSAKNQRKRLEEAGLNPYLMMNGGSAGSAESVTTPSVNPAQPAVGAGQGVSDAGARLGSGLGALGSQLSMVQQINAQKEAVRAARIENAFRIDKEINNLVRTQRENDLLLSKQNLTDVERDNALKQRESLDEQLAMLRVQRSYYGRLMKANTEKEEQEVRSLELRNQYQKFVNDAFPQLNQRQLDLLSAQASSALESALLAKENQKLTREDAKRIAVMTLGETIQNGIKSNEFELSKFGLNAAQLKSMRDGDIVNLKSNYGVASDLYNLLDNAVYHFVNLLGSGLHLQ